MIKSSLVPQELGNEARPNPEWKAQIQGLGKDRSLGRGGGGIPVQTGNLQHACLGSGHISSVHV